MVQAMSDRFKVTYDADADVLYVTKRRDVAARGVEDENGIVWRYDQSGDVLSATVLDFMELWCSRSHELALELSRGLHIPGREAEMAVSRAKVDHCRGIQS
jgi:uncharacterized protein YuzE